MKILMLGNSFTFVNDMPNTLGQMLQAEVVSHSKGGARLAGQLNPKSELGAKTKAALENESWDYVILQEYSTGPIQNPNSFYRSVKALCRRIRANGAEPVLYATWAFKKGGKKLAESGLDYEEMGRALYQAYHKAAEDNDALIADVGMQFHELGDQVNLFASDDYPPNNVGSKLAAAVIANAIRNSPSYPERARKKRIDDEDSRLRVLYLYQMLLRETDEMHPLTGPEIQQRMETEHGIIMHRTTLPRDVEVLRTAGIEVMTERGRAMKYYIGERALSMPELRLLIDAVQSSKFITESKSAELTGKLVAMASRYNESKLRRTVHVTGKAKSDNEKGYYIVDAINDAINDGCKITFLYFDYDAEKNKVLRNNGQPYTLSPYDLIWDGDYYYVVGYCDERDEVRTFRVDRINSQPKMLDEAAVPEPETYRVEKYTQEVFRMYATEELVTVQLLCHEPMMKAIVDKFGIDVPIETEYDEAAVEVPVEDTDEPLTETDAPEEDAQAKDGGCEPMIIDAEPNGAENPEPIVQVVTYLKKVPTGRFRATVNVCPSPTFYRWVFGWGGLVEIEGPEDIRGQFREMLDEEMEKYGRNCVLNEL